MKLLINTTKSIFLIKDIDCLIHLSNACISYNNSIIFSIAWLRIPPIHKKIKKSYSKHSNVQRICIKNFGFEMRQQKN
jgi:hypothetical protein